PARATKKSAVEDVNEAVAVDPTKLDDSARKKAFNRLKTAPDIARVIEGGIETFGAPLMPQQLGLQLMSFLKIPVPDETRRALTSQAQADAAKLVDFSGALSPGAMDL